MHLERWLKEFSGDQLHLIDGEQLRTDPVSVMMQLQHFLQVQHLQDYSKLLRYGVAQLHLIVLFTASIPAVTVTVVNSNSAQLQYCSIALSST